LAPDPGAGEALVNRDTILVVDDEPAILETYRDYLTPPRTAVARARSSRVSPPPSRPGGPPQYQLLLAQGGEEAVELVRAEMAIGGRVLCGFFDMRMPGGIDGLETIRRVRALDPRILIVIVTAYQERSFDDIAPLFAGGHEDEWDYLNKPFTEPEIAQKARNLVASWYRRRREEHYVEELCAVNRSLEDRVRERTLALEQEAQALERALSELTSTQRQLVHKERLAAIGQLCAGLAHEINTPATYALLDLRFLLARRAVTEPDLADVLNNVREGVEHIASITRELRAFSRSDEGRFEDVDLNEVVARALRIANRPLHLQADIVIRRGEGPCVRGDAGQLVQVVVVLLLNATQALDARRRAENVILVTTERRGDEVVLRVSDNGVGIHPDHLDRIFEPFFTTKAAWSGTGLGLSVGRRIVENHRGTLRVETELSVGASFEVALPAAPSARAEAPRDPVPSGVRPRRLRLLVVDDDPHLLAACRRWLARRYDVETACGGAAGIAALEESAAFDAVLCDVMMPGVSGLDLHRIVGKRWPSLSDRVVFMTGGVFADEAQRALDATGRPCLAKPFDLDDVDVCLSEALPAEGAEPGAPSESSG
jgi:signal transduction histidine kinase